MSVEGMKDTQYVIKRHIKSNGRGWGKLHLVEGGSKVALCSVKLRHPVSGRFGRPVEDALLALQERVNRKRSWSYQACKNCIKRAQKLRNPLDRLAEIG